MPVFAYCRFSPRPKSATEKVHSIEVQRASIERWAEREDLDIDDWYEDPDTSARLEPLFERKAGAALIEALAQHGDQAEVVVMKLDRIFRDTIDGLATLRRWKKDGVRLHIVESGVSLDVSRADGELIATMLLAVASHEPKRTSERTSQAMRAKIRRKEYAGGRPPLGQLREGDRLVPDPDFAETRDWVVSSWSEHFNLSRVAAEANRANVPAPNGSKWNHRLVADILRVAGIER